MVVRKGEIHLPTTRCRVCKKSRWSHEFVNQRTRQVVFPEHGRWTVTEGLCVFCAGVSCREEVDPPCDDDLEPLSF